MFNVVVIASGAVGYEISKSIFTRSLELDEMNRNDGNILLLGYKSEQLSPPPLTDQIILTPAGGFLSY